MSEAVKRWQPDKASHGMFSDLLAAASAGTMAGGPFAGGAAAAGVAGKRMLNALLSKRAAKPALINQTADYLTRTGRGRDDVIGDLLRRAAAKSRRAKQAQTIEELVRSLLAPQSRLVPSLASPNSVGQRQ